MEFGSGDKSITNAADFANLIKKLVQDSCYDEVAKLFTDKRQAARSRAFLREAYDDLLTNVCLCNLDESTYEKNAALYNCADEVLKQLATFAPSEDLLIYLLEMVGEQKQDYQFTTALRALQALLLNLGQNKKSKAFDWALNTVRCSLDELNLPPVLTSGYDKQQSALLEQDHLVEDILSRYITIGLFYGSLMQIELKQPCGETIFRDCGVKNRRNLLCCFLIQLLGKPLALLDLTVDDDKHATNLYTLQIARSLVSDATKLMGDPFYLLTLVEQHARFNRRLDSSKGVYEMSCNNIFLNSERLPLEALGIYYYMLFLDADIRDALQAAPKIYTPLFLLESCLYLVNKMLQQNDTPLQLRGMQLANHMVIDIMADRRVPAVALELEVHKKFCELLCDIVGYCQHVELRRVGAVLLRRYIQQFDDEGSYLIIWHLSAKLEHKSLLGYLITIHKDIVGRVLDITPPTMELPKHHRGVLFRNMLLDVCCKLEQGVKTDLIQNEPLIGATLNALLYYAMKDADNRTGFWNLEKEIQEHFLEPLRLALEYSKAHYKLEIKQVESHWNAEKHRHAMDIIDLSCVNDDKAALNNADLTDRERCLSVLQESMLRLNLLMDNWAWTNERIEKQSRARRTLQEMEI